MSKTVFELRVRFKWWVIPYAHTLAFICYSLGTEPDMEKFENLIIQRGLIVYV